MTNNVPSVISHWYHLIEGLRESPLQFYASLEQAIKERQIPDINLFRINYREGNVLSAKREYLRVLRKEHTFDICAAPFGNGFFISWWLGESTGCLQYIPFIGPLLQRFLSVKTYYDIDTALMFQEAVHSAVLEIIDNTTKATGLRALSENERKPILTDLFRY